MASKPRKKASTGFGDYWKVQAYLSAQHKRELAGMDLDGEFPITSIFELVEQSYKYSLTYNQKNDVYIATLTDNGEGSPSQHGVLNGYGATPVNAHASLFYKHQYVLDGIWIAHKPDDSDDELGFG